jgi:hypothetical protein
MEAREPSCCWLHGLAPTLSFGLGPVGIQVGIESAIQTVVQKRSCLIVLRQDAAGNVERLEYDIGQPFDLTFDADGRSSLAGRRTAPVHPAREALSAIIDLDRCGAVVCRHPLRPVRTRDGLVPRGVS